MGGVGTPSARTGVGKLGALQEACSGNPPRDVNALSKRGPNPSPSTTPSATPLTSSRISRAKRDREGEGSSPVRHDLVVLPELRLRYHQGSSEANAQRGLVRVQLPSRRQTHREERQPQEDARLVLLRRDRGRRTPVPHISETSIPQRPPNKRRLIRQSVATP